MRFGRLNIGLPVIMAVIVTHARPSSESYGRPSAMIRAQVCIAQPCARMPSEFLVMADSALSTRMSGPLS
jgi:hypothetical protein